MPLLQCQNISKLFGDFAALTKLDVSIEAGDIVGIVGPNGAGKTTFFNVVTGYLTPESGKILFLDKEIHKKPPHKIFRMGISRTYQIPECFHTMTTLENVFLSRHYSGRNSKSETANEECMEILSFVGLSEKRDDLVGNLPLYDRKMLMIATALAGKPELLMLDEPLAGLSPAEIGTSLKLFKSIRKKGLTLIIIEHHLKEVMSVSDKIIFLSHGEKIAEGKPEDVAKSKRVIEEYVGVG